MDAPPPDSEIAVDPPPPLPRSGSANPAARAIPLIGAFAALGTVAAVIGSGSPVGHNPMLLVFPATMVLSALATAITQGGRSRDSDYDTERRRYLKYLDGRSRALTEAAVRQRYSLLQRYPDPDALWVAVGGRGLWSHRRGATGFGRVRAGTGSVPALTRARVDGSDQVGDRDPVTHDALDGLLSRHHEITNAPVAIDLLVHQLVSIDGDLDRARGLLRSLLGQLAVSHHPADIAVTTLTDRHTAALWDWVKWLPQHRSPGHTPANRHVVVIVDGPPAPPATVESTILLIGPAADADQRLTITTDGLLIGAHSTMRPDDLSIAGALALARRLAPYRGMITPTGSGWLSRMGITDIAQVGPATCWQPDNEPVLRIPIGVDSSGRPVELDIREAALGGMGPHGLCVGSTGSGKSELLRTIALGMIATHAPEQLNLILIDFKGGATFLGLATARHTAAVITNLEEEAHLVDRMSEALRGEIDRRQQILRAAGNVTGLADYRRARRSGRHLDPVPSLFIIVDEFAELLSRHPDFLEVFVAIARQGRSLGIHLLLASQRLDEGRLRGLDANLAYRICLKTLTAGESRIVLGIPDAYTLVNQPGAAYVKVGAGEPVRFQTDYVSGALDARPATAAASAPRLFTGVDDHPIDAVVATDQQLLDAVVERLAGHGRPAHQVWLPPAAASPRLVDLLHTEMAELKVPIGVVDRVFDHRREPLVVDLSGAAGHMAIIGGPQSGKSDTVATTLTALAATHNPDRVHIYCVDFGGGGLVEHIGLPHIGAVAGRTDHDLVRRIIAELTDLLRARSYTGCRAADPHVLLVIDGWPAFRQEHTELEPAVTALATEGLSYRMHVVLTAPRWADIRPALRDQLGTRLELRLGDPADSEIDRHRARQVPRGRPGTGLTVDGAPMLIARTDGVVARSGATGAPSIRLLPNIIEYEELIGHAPATGLMLGLAEKSLQPVGFDPAAEHLLILGESGSGKTATLRVICQEIIRQASSAHLVVVDPRRALADAHPAAQPLTDDVLDLLAARAASGPIDTAPVHIVIDDCDVAGAALAPLVPLLPQARDIGLHLTITRRSGGAARALYDPLLAGVREHGCAALLLSAHPDDGSLLAGIRSQRRPPGRGVLVGRDGEQTIQVAWRPPR